MTTDAMPAVLSEMTGVKVVHAFPVTGSVVVWYSPKNCSDRNSAIGVVLAFGVGVGVYLLSLYEGFATAATNMVFGRTSK